MGFLDKVLGNAVGVDLKEADALVGPLLIPGETVTHAYLVGVRDMMIFTQKRLISCDKTGISGKRMAIISWPWRNILSWTMTTAGSIDIDSELSIRAQGMTFPLEMKFPKKTDTRPIVQAISSYVL